MLEEEGSANKKLCFPESCESHTRYETEQCNLLSNDENKPAAQAADADPS